MSPFKMGDEVVMIGKICGKPVRSKLGYIEQEVELSDDMEGEQYFVPEKWLAHANQTTELNAASTDDLMSELRRRYPGIVFTFNPAPIGDDHDNEDGQPY